MDFQIRLLCATDSIADLTALLHRAYAPLAAAGMRFGACDQTEAVTLARANEGECYLIEHAGAVVGTITLSWPAMHPAEEAARKVAHYRRPDVACFAQFGVEPRFGGRGLGGALLSHVEARAKDRGACEIACDTSERATDLVETYTRRGYRLVEHVQWDSTNYRSVVLSKRL